MTGASGPSLASLASLASPAALAALGLAAARAVPVTWLVAPLGGARVPAPVRVGFGLLLAGLAVPSLRAAAAAVSGAGPLLLALLVARELLIGAVLALVVSLAFRAAEAAGWLADAVRGANVAEVLLPTADERASPLGALYALVACVVFLEIGGVARLCEALARSYQAVPIGGLVTAGGAVRAAAVVIAASAKLLEAALALAAPVLVAVWATDLTLGMLARAVPELPAYFIGLPLKGLLGLGVVLVGLGGLHVALARGFAWWMALAGRAMGAWP
jgi:flagellar biosynthesis protein FliR